MTTETTTTVTTETAPSNDRLDAITKDLVELGTIWAKYGLSIGRQALETSAKSLSKTANLLGQIADAVDAKKPEGEAKGAALAPAGAAPSAPMSDILPSRPSPTRDGHEWLLATLAVFALWATVMLEWWRSSGR